MYAPATLCCSSPLTPKGPVAPLGGNAGAGSVAGNPKGAVQVAGPLDAVSPEVEASVDYARLACEGQDLCSKGLRPRPHGSWAIAISDLQVQHELHGLVVMVAPSRVNHAHNVLRLHPGVLIGVRKVVGAADQASSLGVAPVGSKVRVSVGCTLSGLDGGKDNARALDSSPLQGQGKQGQGAEVSESLRRAVGRAGPSSSHQ